VTGTVFTAQLVIFDLDGTLTGSAEGIVASFLHALSHIGAAVPDGDLTAQIVGPPMDDTFRSMELGENTEEAIAAFRAEYGTRGWAMNTLFDGIEPLLADLRAAGVRLAVATSKLEPTAGASSPISGWTSISRSSPGQVLTARAKPRSRCWPTRFPSCSRCPSTCSWSATAATTCTARPPTASTPWWSAGATGRPTSATGIRPSATPS
jgi:Haloacid dehalogenase-like hydrolase